MKIYCMANDFCKECSLRQEKYMVEDKNHKHRNKPNRMSDAEIMIILILFPFLSRKFCWTPCTGISFVDSTPLRVCRNQRECG